jgi:hypothetical protein
MTDVALDSVFSDPLPASEAIQRGTGRPAKGGYTTADGKRIPSVTTITGRFKESGALLHWANRMGLEGKNLAEARDSATDVGSLVHKMIEADIHGTERPEVPDDFAERVASAFTAWQEWMEATKLEVVATELALVSEANQFGGTLDCVVRDGKGRLALADWKTSAGVYSEYLTQIAAYGALWNETQDEPLTGGYYLVRISKEHGDLETRHWPELGDALDLFLLLRTAYDLDKAVGKRAK